jgi:hypothetical protein
MTPEFESGNAYLKKCIFYRSGEFQLYKLGRVVEGKNFNKLALKRPSLSVFFLEEEKIANHSG